MNLTHDKYGDIRDAIRGLLAEFLDDYFLKIDEARGYPEQFVDALTQAGWLAALVPQEYGGSGLGLAEASVTADSASPTNTTSNANFAKRACIRSLPYRPT